MKVEISVNVNVTNPDRRDDTFDIRLSGVSVRNIKSVLKSLPEALAKNYAGIAPITLNKKHLTPEGAEEFIRKNCTE